MSTVPLSTLSAADPVQDLHARGLTDGLPVEVPTPERVAAHVAASGLAAGQSVAAIPPFESQASVEQIAANAVMAGCTPELMPALIAAVRAIANPAFNLYGVRTSNHPATPLAIVSGPIVERLGFNHSTNVFGPASRANATLGRAINLVIQNVAGLTPQLIDQSTVGHPGRYTYCIAEDPESPWGALRARDADIPADADVVSMFAADAPIAVADYASAEPDGLVESFAYHLAYIWQNPFYATSEVLLVANIAHARILAGSGWDRDEILRRVAAAARRRTGPLPYDEAGYEYEKGVYLSCAGGPWGQYSALVNGWVGPGPGSSMVTEVVQQ